MRKQLDELESKRSDQPQPEPQDGEKSPQNPRDPEQRAQGEPGEGGGQGQPKDNTPTWIVNLPPQVRDAYARGDFEKIPPQYRELIQRYLEWLNRAVSEEGPATGSSR